MSVRTLLQQIFTRDVGNHICTFFPMEYYNIRYYRVFSNEHNEATKTIVFIEESVNVDYIHNHYRCFEFDAHNKGTTDSILQILFGCPDDSLTQLAVGIVPYLNRRQWTMTAGDRIIWPSFKHIVVNTFKSRHLGEKCYTKDRPFWRDYILVNGENMGMLHRNDSYLYHILPEFPVNSQNQDPEFYSEYITDNDIGQGFVSLPRKGILGREIVYEDNLAP